MAMMRAVVVRPGVAGSVRLIEAPRPAPRDDEALVRVLRVGVCGTDREILDGRLGEAPAGEPHLIIGHESLGVVERAPVGSSLHPGDLVTAIVRRPDGCEPCRAGRWDMCRTGAYRECGIRGRHGFMCEYFTERPEFLVPVPPSLATVGPLAETAAVVAKVLDEAESLQRRLPWTPRHAAVLGAGPVGLLATLALRLRGVRVSTFDIVDPHTPKARIVRDCGASYIDSRTHPLRDVARTDDPLDLIVEASGVSALAFEAMEALGANGVLVLTSVTGGSRALEIDGNALYMSLVMGNKLVLGSVNASRAHFERAVAELASVHARWPGLLERLITRRTPLRDTERALAPDPLGIKTFVEMEA